MKKIFKTIKKILCSKKELIEESTRQLGYHILNSGIKVLEDEIKRLETKMEQKDKLLQEMYYICSKQNKVLEKIYNKKRDSKGRYVKKEEDGTK